MSRIYPILFVLLWSTGFIGAKFGLPYAEPLTFLLTRYFLVTVLMLGVAVLTRAPWPKEPRQWLHIAVTGILMHAVYLGGVFVSLGQGFPTALCSLVVGLQPILTAFAAGVLLGERVLTRQWIGLALGLIGIALVLVGRISSGVGMDGITPSLLALVGITLGTIYQKRFCAGFDWRTGAVIQFIAAAIITAPAAYYFESFRLEPNAELIFALGWLVIVLSVVAMSLLNHLIRSGSSVNVASLFYLVPATTAALALILFHESLSVTTMVGMGVSLWGVSLSRS